MYTKRFLDHETTKNINDQFSLLDGMLLKFRTLNDDKISNKLLMIRDRMVRYFQINYDEFETGSDDNLCFSFNIGVLSGITSYYTQHKNLTKGHIGDLNKIYKKYKVTK